MTQISKIQLQDNLKVAVLYGSQGKFTYEDGHVYEGEFVDDQMMTHTRAPTPLPGKTPTGHSKCSACHQGDN